MNFASIFKTEPTRQTFTAGDVLIRQGDANEMMFIILSGELEVRVAGKVGAILKEGDLFGELSMIDQEPASGDVVAVSDGEFVSLNEKRFVSVSQQNPFFMMGILRAVTAKLRAMNQSVAGS